MALSSLFDAEHDTLVVQHFMFDPADENGCSSCSLWSDSFDGLLPHIKRKASFAVVARAKPEQLRAMKARKGWRFPFLSAFASSFGADMSVSYTDEQVASKDKLYNFGSSPVWCREMPGVSVFHKSADGAIFLTYNTFSRGLEPLCSIWNLFDALPNGRDEKRPMDWLKHKEAY